MKISFSNVLIINFDLCQLIYHCISEIGMRWWIDMGSYENNGWTIVVGVVTTTMR